VIKKNKEKEEKISNKKLKKKKQEIKKKKVTKSGSDIEKEIHNNYNSDSDIDYETLYTIGDNVIVCYEGKYFPGVINDTNPDGA